MLGHEVTFLSQSFLGQTPRCELKFPKCLMLPKSDLVRQRVAVSS